MIAILAAIALIAQVPARAQEPDEDHRMLCPIISPELAAKAAEKVKDKGKCEVVCKGCGCKGGPGYRGPRGCVGWADLIRTCGPPPHAGCSAECAIVKPGCRGRAWLKTFAAGIGLAGGLSFAASQTENAEDGTQPHANARRARRAGPATGHGTAPEYGAAPAQ